VMDEFSERSLAGARFHRVDLTGASFDHVDLGGASFYEVDLSGVKIRGAHLRTPTSPATWTACASTGSTSAR
jgi:uncharacterized protein YjbI with pentapeptide repeats